jgi:WhiB family redox-sensing transcriptional regulator
MRDLPARAEVCEMLTMIVEARNERSWRHQAACKGMDPDTFFPAAGDWHAMQEAKAVCATCPVSTQCSEAARTEHTGVWAGTSATQRRNKGVSRNSFNQQYRLWVLQTEPSDEVAAYDLGIQVGSVRRSRYPKNTQ